MTMIVVELQKWKRNKTVWSIFALTFLLGIFAVNRACSISRSSPLMDQFSDLYTLAFKNLTSLFLPIALGMFATTLFFDEQKNDTLKELWIIPISKSQLYFSKVAVIILMSLILCVFTFAIGATFLYLVPVVIAPAYLMGAHPLASVMGIYSSLSPVSADMVRSWTQGVTVTLSPSLCLISIFTVGIVFTILSIIVLRKRSY